MVKWSEKQILIRLSIVIIDDKRLNDMKMLIDFTYFLHLFQYVCTKMRCFMNSSDKRT